MNFYKPPLEQQDLTIQQFGKWWAVAVVVNDISIGVDNDEYDDRKVFVWDSREDGKTIGTELWLNTND